MTTAQQLYALTGGSARASLENGREFATITRKFETEAQSMDWLRTARTKLRARGWQVTAFSNGFGHRDGARYFTAGIDAMRGDGPRTAYENHMIATCTGND